MAIEQALGIKLTLVANLGNAARELSGELNAVAESLKAVRDLGKTFNLDGITQLNKEVTSLNQRASAAAKSVGALSQNLKEAEGAGNAAASGVNASAGAADRVRTAASGAAQSVIKMGDAMARAKEQGSALAILHTGFDLIEGSAGAASRQVNNLADAVLRLAGAQRLALPGESAYTPRYGVIPQSSYSNPSFVALPGAGQRALPSGDGPRFAPIPQPAYRSSATAALSSGEMLALGGGTDPYFNSRAWWANQRAQGTSAGSGPSMIVPPGGFGGGGGGGGGDFFGGAGNSMKKFGDSLQSQGWALAVNGGMLAAALVPAIKSAMDIDDLLHRTYEALKAGGATESAAKEFSDATRAISRQVGSNYRETVSAGYNFISAMPAGLNLNDPKVMATVIEGYKRTAMMTVAGSSSTHPVSMEEGALDVNNVIANLGLDTSSPEKLAKAYRTATNLLINLKNRTSTEIDMAAQSIKGIGPIAKEMGIDPAEIAALIGMEAEGKVRGATAGYAIKRLLQRQSVPSKKTLNLIETVRKLGGNISLFDDQGNVRPLLDLMADTTRFEDSGHVNAQNKAMIQGQLAGLYAVGNLDLMQDQIRKHGGSAGARAYGESLLHGTIAGGKTGDATTDSYEARQQGNTRIQAAKVSSDFQDTAYKTFKDIQPFLTSLLKDIDGLINAFDRLPTPVKSALSEMLILGTMFSVVAGGAAILIGNFIKFGGVVMDVVGVGVKIVGWVGKLVEGFGVLESVGEAVGSVIAALAGIITLPVVAIGALVAAIGLGVVAWVKDWGGIREKTGAAVQWIIQEIPKIPEQLGYALARGALFMIDFGAKWLNFWAHFPETAYDGIKFVLGYLVDNVPKWAETGLRAITSWGNAILKALPGIGRTILGGIEAVLHVLNPVTWVKAGIGLANNFTKGIVQGIKDGKPQIKEAQQQIRDLHPGSEPKDTSSPLYGMGKSGEAFSDMFINGILDGFRNGVPKVKKALKPVADALVDLRGESISEVEKTAKAIEDTLASHGAVIKDRWMVLMSGGHAARYYGDTSAVHMAVREDKAKKGPDPLKNAEDYLKRLNEYPQTYKQIMTKLHTWLNAANAAELQHEVSAIDALIARVHKAHDNALAKLGKPFTGRGGAFAQIDRGFMGEGKDGDAFDKLQERDDAKLQRMIEGRKNQELPTLAELRKEREFEITERDHLQTMYDKEIAQRDKLVALIQDTLDKAKAINGSDQASRDLKEKLIAQASAYQVELDGLNDRLETQNTTITKLNKSIKEYNDNIKGASDMSTEWAQILGGAFAQAANDALKSLGDSLMNGLDSLLSRVFGAKRKGMAGIVGSFFAEMFSNVGNTLVSSFEKRLSANFNTSLGGLLSSLFHLGDGSSSTASSASAVSPLQSAYNALQTIPSDAVQKVQLTDSTGVDLSQSISDNIQTTASNTDGLAKAQSVIADATKKGNATSPGDTSGSGDAISNAMDKFLKSNVGRSLMGIAGAYSGYEMASAPGGNDMTKLMGAFGTYESISSMPGGQTPVGQGVAIAAGLATLFSHQDDPAKMPDKYMPGYQDWLKSFNSGAGDLGYQLESDIKSVSPTSLTGQALADYNQLKQLGGASGDIGIKSEKDGVFTLGSGAQVSVTDFMALTNRALNEFGSNLLNASNNANQLAASFTALILGGPAGFSMPLLRAGGGGSISPSAPGLNPVNPPGRSLPGSIGNPPSQHPPIVVQILPNAQVAGDPSSLASAIQGALPQLENTIVQIVRRADYRDSRLRGNYESAVA